MADDRDEGTPALRVLRGEPTAEELAALVAVLTARAADVPAARPARSAWADPAPAIRGPVHATPGGWRRSGLPG